MLVLENLKTQSFPNSALYEQEVKLLVSVANRFIEKYPTSARKELRGSFKLVGRHNGDRPKDIMSFDFPGGVNIGHQKLASFEMVDHLIGRGIDMHDFAAFGLSEDNTLSIKTKYGYFVMAAAMAPRDLSWPLLLQMATAIKQLGYAPSSSDRTLAFSIDSLHVSRENRSEMFRLEMELMGNYFSSTEMKEWLMWHRNHFRAKGGEELGFFFEEDEHKTTNLSHYHANPSAELLRA